MSDKPTAFSLSRLLAVVAPIIAIAFGLQYVMSSGWEAAARQDLESNILARLLGPEAVGPTEAITFTDADGDLVADAPADDQCVTPEKLVFSYISSPEPGEAAGDWKDVTEALGEALGIPVEYKSYATTIDQLSALATGELHVAGFNTGAVPLAVRTSGFVPVCTFGREDGGYGYTMKILAPAGSGVTEPDDLQGKKVTFVRPDSNSGCKAALVLLMNEYNLLPESGYRWGFSMGHDKSILDVAAGQIEAAPVASDFLDRMIAAGEVDEDKLTVVYESERFPPAALGYAYNLAPELREKIATALLAFDWSGSSVESKYGSAGYTQFVAINFKDDWANIRRVDDAARKSRSAKVADGSSHR